jgi:hypothetical protein
LFPYLIGGVSVLTSNLINLIYVKEIIIQSLSCVLTEEGMKREGERIEELIGICKTKEN